MQTCYLRMAVLGYQQLPTEYQFLNELGLDFVVLTGTNIIGRYRWVVC